MKGRHPIGKGPKKMIEFLKEFNIEVYVKMVGFHLERQKGLRK